MIFLLLILSTVFAKEIDAKYILGIDKKVETRHDRQDKAALESILDKLVAHREWQIYHKSKDTDVCVSIWSHEDLFGFLRNGHQVRQELIKRGFKVTDGEHGKFGVDCMMACYWTSICAIKKEK